VAGKPGSSLLLLHPLAPEAGGSAYHSGGRQFGLTRLRKVRFGSAFEKRREFVEYAYPDRGPRDSKKRPSVDSILSVSLVFHLFSPIFFSLS